MREVSQLCAYAYFLREFSMACDMVLLREIKCKKSHPWYKLYDKHGFLHLISRRFVQFSRVSAADGATLRPEEAGQSPFMPIALLIVVKMLPFTAKVLPLMVTVLPFTVPWCHTKSE